MDRGAGVTEQQGPSTGRGGALGSLWGSPLPGCRPPGEQRPPHATRLARTRGHGPVCHLRRCGWTEHAAYMERMGATSSREAIRMPISQMQAVSSRAHVGSPLALPWPKTWEQGRERDSVGLRNTGTMQPWTRVLGTARQSRTLLGPHKHRHELVRIPSQVPSGERSQGWRGWLPLPVQPPSRQTPQPSLHPEQPLSPWDPHPVRGPSSAWPQPAWSRAPGAQDGHAAGGQQPLLQLRGHGGGLGMRRGARGACLDALEGAGSVSQRELGLGLAG